eukprot:4544767-Ditylum_brightwellii.AAC.1
METPEHVVQKNRAKPGLMATLLSSIDLWQNQEESTEPITRDEELKQVFPLQNKIGWDCALEGILSTKWKEIQESYLKSIESKETGERFIAALIQKLWDTSWDFWQHPIHYL